MPTRPGFDLVPVRKETKARLAQRKGARTFDEVLRELLDAAPIPHDSGSKMRDPEEQIALAQLAARRWARAVKDGRIVELGPRLLLYRTRSKSTRRRMSIEWSGRRGFSP